MKSKFLETKLKLINTLLMYLYTRTNTTFENYKFYIKYQYKFDPW